MPLSWTWCQVPAISALGRLRQEDHEFGVALGYSRSMLTTPSFLCSLRAEGRMGLKDEPGQGVQRRDSSRWPLI